MSMSGSMWKELGKNLHHPGAAVSALVQRMARDAPARLAVLVFALVALVFTFLLTLPVHCAP